MSFSMTSHTCNTVSPNRILSSSMVRICRSVNTGDTRNRSSPHLANGIVVLDSQQARSEQDLELLDDDLAGLVYTDEGTDDIARFPRPEL